MKLCLYLLMKIPIVLIRFCSLCIPNSISSIKYILYVIDDLLCVMYGTRTRFCIHKISIILLFDQSIQKLVESKQIRSEQKIKKKLNFVSIDKSKAEYYICVCLLPLPPPGSSKSKTSRFQETRLTLRIHRGRRSNSVPRITTPFTDNHLKASKSIETTSLDRRVGYLQKTRTENQLKVNDAAAIELTTKSPILHMMQITLNRKENMESFLCGQQKPGNVGDGKVATDVNGGGAAATAATVAGGSKTIRGVGKRILKVQAKRFRIETKAARTLGIIVTAFILSWIGFFTAYVVKAFCPTCIQPMLFSVLFWLGYCNSAINPLIYALFSKDFRLAFTNIICKCMRAQCLDNQQLNSHSNKNLLQSNVSADGSRSR